MAIIIETLFLVLHVYRLSPGQEEVFLYKCPDTTDIYCLKLMTFESYKVIKLIKNSKILFVGTMLCTAFVSI